MDKKILVEVAGIRKRFAKELKTSLLYGVSDIFQTCFGGLQPADTLRGGEFWALNNVSFNLYEGEIVAIVGSNGSGKTTLMRLISSIYMPDSGAIKFSGIQKVTSLFALNAGLNPLFTGKENIILKAALYGMNRVELEQKMSFIAEFSELGEKLDSPVGNYSSGMKARLSYSVAIATQPDLFIIDEALAVGDSMFRAKCYDHLKTYVRQPNKSILYVTNRINKVKSLADRVLVLDKGCLVMDTYDISMGLDFYYTNCLKNLNPRERELKMRRIHEYD